MINVKKLGLGTFDLIKGIGAITIVIGHTLNNYVSIPSEAPIVFLLIGNLLNNLFRSFNFIFIIICGLSFRVDDIKMTLKKTTSYLLKPYLIVALLVMLLFPIIHYLNFHWWPGAISETIKYFFTFLLGIPGGRQITIFKYNLYDCGAIYFFLLLFIGNNLLNLIMKIKKNWLIHMSVIGCALLSYILFEFDFIYFCLPQALLSVPLLYTGYLIRNNNLLDKIEKNKILVFILFVIGLLEALIGRFNYGYGEYNYYFLNVLGSFCRSIVILIIATKLEFNGFISNKIQKIGMYIFFIMCAHTVEIISIPWYRIREFMGGNLIISCTIELICRIVIIYLACKSIKKIQMLKYRKIKQH